MRKPLVFFLLFYFSFYVIAIQQKNKRTQEQEQEQETDQGFSLGGLASGALSAVSSVAGALFGKPSPSPPSSSSPPPPSSSSISYGGWDCCRICAENFYPDFDQAYDPPYIQNDTTSTAIPTPAPPMTPLPPPDSTGVNGNTNSAASGFGIQQRQTSYSFIEKVSDAGFGDMLKSAASAVKSVVSGLLGDAPPPPPPSSPSPPPPPTAAIAVKEFRCCNVCPYETVQKAKEDLPPSFIQLNLKNRIKTKIKEKGKTAIKHKNKNKKELPGFDVEVSLPPCCDFCRQIYFPKIPEAPTLDFPEPPGGLAEIRERRSQRPSREWRILLKEQELKAREESEQSGASFIQTDARLERRRAHPSPSSSSSPSSTPLTRSKGSKESIALIGSSLLSVGDKVVNHFQSVGEDLMSDLQIGENIENNMADRDRATGGSTGVNGVKGRGSTTGGSARTGTGTGYAGIRSSSSSTGGNGGNRATGVGYAVSDAPFPPDSDACCHRCAKRDATTEGIMFWGST